MNGCNVLTLLVLRESGQSKLQDDLFRRGEVLPAGRTNEEESRLTAKGREDGGLKMADGAGKRNGDQE